MNKSTKIIKLFEKKTDKIEGLTFEYFDSTVKSYNKDSIEYEVVPTILLTITLNDGNTLIRSLNIIPEHLDKVNKYLYKMLSKQDWTDIESVKKNMSQNYSMVISILNYLKYNKHYVYSQTKD